VILWAAVVAAEGVALLGAILLARRCSLRRWWIHSEKSVAACDGAHVVVMLVAYALLDEVLLEVGHRWIFAGAPRPFAGLVRAAYHLETALVLGWPALLVTAAWRVFDVPRWDRASGRRVRPSDGVWAGWGVLGCWVVVAGGMALRYPMGRTWTTRTLHLFEVACVLCAGGAVVRAWRREWGTAQVSVLLLVGVELAVGTIGPFVRDPFADWRLASCSYLIGFVCLAALQAHALGVIESGE
jgi:hypothetical protein